ncbi:MAG: hypothetical protein Q8S13_09330 [Dehalococcoidia bacterium]|nr:hypothetical protein [Dehalococcoidia bacterium]
MKPTVGQIVHYYQDDRTPLAAIITAVDPVNRVQLTVFWPRDAPFPVRDHHGNISTRVPFAEAPTPGHWSWPPRE